MVGRPKEGILRLPGVTLAVALICWPAAAQSPLALVEAAQRRLPDYTPLHYGEKARVTGTVSAGVYHFPNYMALNIDDGRNGLSLETVDPDKRLESFNAGDMLIATGTVSMVAGMMTLMVDDVQKTGHQDPPAPLAATLQDLHGFRYMSRLVRTSGRVVDLGDTISGGYFVLRQNGTAYRIFLPRSEDWPAPSLEGIDVGDDVEVTGGAFLYSARPPYNRGFELLVNSRDGIVRTSRSWSVSPLVLASAMAGVLVIIFALWHREQRLKNQRERLRKTYQLGEEILSASSVEAILKRIQEALPAILGVTRVHLYLHNRGAKTLEGISGDTGDAVSISLAGPPAGPEAGAVACFHYRTLLVIPDIEKSPFPIANTEHRDAPKSLLFVPMMAQGEVLGVLELDQDDRKRDFPADEQALAQHLGNQIGVSLRLLDQRSVQEQLFRTEKLAAVGRLISGVVNELQTPLSSISDLATRAMERAHGPVERELGAIAAESQKAASMVARLVSFAANEQVEARPVAVTALLRNLIDFREGEWRASGIRLRDLTSSEPVLVLGSQGQLEQVFLNLLVHAEQSLHQGAEKTLTIRSSVLAKRLLVEIVFTAPPESRKPEETAAVLGVTRGIIAGHGGEVRLIEKAGSGACFEVELPISARERTAPASSIHAAPSPGAETSRRLTALLIEPDETAQRQLTALLSGRGYRVVPVDNADTGMDLAHRMRFDAAFCSVHAPGLNWVELSERLQSRVGGFILLSDGFDAELAGDFEGDGRFVLPKPFQEAELARVLRFLERVPSPKVIPIKNLAG